MEILNLIGRLSKNSLSLASNSLRLAKLEIALAKKSLPVLAGLLFLLMLLITAFWVFLVALLITHLRTKGISLYHALLGILAAHLVLIIIVSLVVNRYLKHLKLPTTRHHIRTMFK